MRCTVYVRCVPFVCTPPRTLVQLLDSSRGLIQGPSLSKDDVEVYTDVCGVVPGKHHLGKWRTPCLESCGTRAPYVLYGAGNAHVLNMLI